MKCPDYRESCSIVLPGNNALRLGAPDTKRVELIERLLRLLDVRLHTVAMCAVDRGVRFSVRPMETVVVHYVLQGEGLVQIRKSRPVRLTPGMLVFVPQGTGHDLISGEAETSELVSLQEKSESYGDGLMRIAGGVSPDSLVTAYSTIKADCEGIDLFERLREPAAEDLSGNVAVRRAFEALSCELEQPRFGTRPLAEAIMKQCLVLALRQQMERGDLSLLTLIGAVDPRLTRALLAILEDPANDHRLEDLAEESGMSRSLFAERFAEAFQRPPMDLVRQVRLHRAANLLRATSLPVQVVALSVGYASRSYFSRAFRATYGQDPKSFRKSAGKNRFPNSRSPD